ERVGAVAARSRRGLDTAAARGGHHVREGTHRPARGRDKEISRHDQLALKDSGGVVGGVGGTASRPRHPLVVVAQTSQRVPVKTGIKGLQARAPLVPLASSARRGY